jgi:hypothetical protein
MATRNEVSNGARYGLFVGCLLTVARFGPAAWLGVWVFVFCQFCLGTSIAWTRTRLPFMTVAMLLAAIDALLMGIWIGNNDSLTTLPSVIRFWPHCWRWGLHYSCSLRHVFIPTRGVGCGNTTGGGPSATCCFSGTFPIFAASPRHTLRTETRLIAHFFALTILSN